MTHQCPKCELRFSWHTELEDHCRTDHPAFHHDYPASTGRTDYAGTGAVRSEAVDSIAAADQIVSTSAILHTWWTER